MPATGLGSQVYRYKVLSTGCSSTGVLVWSLLIQVVVRCERQVAIVVKHGAHLLVGWWIAGILARSFGWVVIVGVAALSVC